MHTVRHAILHSKTKIDPPPHLSLLIVVPSVLCPLPSALYIIRQLASSVAQRFLTALFYWTVESSIIFISSRCAHTLHTHTHSLNPHIYEYLPLRCLALLWLFFIRLCQRWHNVLIVPSALANYYAQLSLMFCINYTNIELKWSR